MIGDLRKRRKDHLKERQRQSDIIKREEFVTANNELKVYHDIDERHEKPHKGDPGISNMYMRKSKGKNVQADASSEYLNGVLNVTKAAVIGGVGMGIIGSIGAMARKKKKSSKPKRKSCSCKKK